MDKHAIALLAEAESWTWPPTLRILEKQGGNYKAIMLKLLSYLIKESQLLGGTVLDQFWKQVEECHPKFKENVSNIRNAPSVLFDEAPAMLFEGVDRNDVDFEPIFKMAAEYFTHLGIAFMNPGGPKSGGGTPHSVSDVVKMETDQLLSVAQEVGFGVRKQAALKRLSFKRDGYSCVMTGVKFNEVHSRYKLHRGYNFNPILSHIIPNSVHGEPDTLKCIAMFAGNEARDLVVQHLNAIGNVMNLEKNAHEAYNDLQWGIEAWNEDGMVKYVYRRVPLILETGPASITLRDGDPIKFGLGTEGSRLGGGPLPLLCNLQLAVARALNMSGAAEVISQLMEDADDSDFPHILLSSKDFCDILDAKLLLKSICL
ncbi:hypothetical protein D9615_008842 [Tricholomella constricta]|uniref:HNH nuclease domain-containing protein n=1 Tax=Tricholomella constricta TaxID=117010 RepID=A0A8H5H0E8_9AGAR|nr:hypothetical protein D9615_008842 [Tricholomella constricta]